MKKRFGKGEMELSEAYGSEIGLYESKEVNYLLSRIGMAIKGGMN